jgi:hypothetical protein
MLGLIFVAVGCGPAVVPVTGRVTLDAKPLPNAKVVFMPEMDRKEPGPGSIGTTDADGRFTLHLLTGTTNGAIVGKHKISISAYNEVAEEGKPAHMKGFGTPLVPSHYNAQTKLTFDVPAGGTSTADFDLKSEPGDDVK